MPEEDVKDEELPEENVEEYRANRDQLIKAILVIIAIAIIWLISSSIY